MAWVRATMRLAAIAALLAACSGGGGAGGGAGGGHGTGPGSARVDAGTPLSAAPLTVRECDELISHAVTLAGSDHGSGSAAPTPAELDEVASSLRADLGVRCAQLPRAAHACAMAATTLAELAACER